MQIYKNQQKKGLILIKSLSQIIDALLWRAKDIEEVISGDTFNGLKNRIKDRFNYAKNYNYSDRLISNAIYQRRVTNLPPSVGYNPYLAFEYEKDSFILTTKVQSIYLGGMHTIVGKKRYGIFHKHDEKSITLNPNTTSYIWLSRSNDNLIYADFDVTDSDHGYNDDIHYSRILIARVKTDDNGITEVTSYPTRNYPVFTV